jgi:excisionase family DNA binding protein
MTPDPRPYLRALVRGLPAGTLVPVPLEWLNDLLEGTGPSEEASAPPPADLTVKELAARLGRQPSTVRGWVAAGQFPEAYRLQGRELRIPLASVMAFEEQQRLGGPVKGRGLAARRREKSADLAAWRRQVAS